MASFSDVLSGLAETLHSLFWLHKRWKDWYFQLQLVLALSDYRVLDSEMVVLFTVQMAPVKCTF